MREKIGVFLKKDFDLFFSKWLGVSRFNVPLSQFTFAAAVPKTDSLSVCPQVFNSITNASETYF